MKVLFQTPRAPPREAPIGPPSLRDYCIRTLAVHFDDVESAGPLDSRLYAQIVCHAECRATPEAVARLEGQHPHLASAESDACFWRNCQRCVAAARQGLAPMPVLIERVAEGQAELERWIAHPDHPPSPPPTGQKTPPPRGKPRVRPVERALKALSQTPATVELLRQTSVGKTLAKFVKRCPRHDPVLATAADLLDKWKHQAKLDDDYLLSHLGKVETWKQLYFLLDDAEDHKRRKFSARAKELAIQAASAKRWTREVDPDDIPGSATKRKRRQEQSKGLALSFRNVSRPRDGPRRITGSTPTRAPPGPYSPLRGQGR